MLRPGRAATWFENELAGVLWSQLCWFNLIWSCLNLLPVRPLDGGEIADALLKLKMRAFEAERIGCRIGIATGVSCGVGLLFLGLEFFPFILFYLAPT